MRKADAYRILGLTSSANHDDVKRAYKALAKKYHPDINKEPEAVERFQEISTAYSILISNSSDENHYFRKQTNVNVDDIFANATFGQNKPRVSVELSLAEAHHGCSKIVKSGEKFFQIDIPAGQAGDNVISLSNMIVNVKIVSDEFEVDGMNLVKILTLSPMEFQDLNNFELQNHVGKKFNISLEKVDTLTTLRVPKAGLFCSKTNKKGDLMIKLVVSKK